MGEGDAESPETDNPDTDTGARLRAATLHLSAIGLVESGWAGFESMIDSYAILLAQIPYDVGLCFTAQVMGSSRKLDAYIALARLRGAAILAGDLEKFAKDTAGLAERRNRVVHDPWIAFSLEGGFRLEMTARRMLRHIIIETGTENVVQLANDITTHCGRLTDIHSRVLAAIGTSQHKRE
jgi:hypothetical protein